RRQQVQDEVLVLVGPAVLLGLLERAERLGPLVAVLAVPEHDQRVLRLGEKVSGVEVAAGHAVPGHGAAAQAQPPQSHDGEPTCPAQRPAAYGYVSSHRRPPSSCPVAVGPSSPARTVPATGAAEPAGAALLALPCGYRGRGYSNPATRGQEEKRVRARPRA